MDRYDVAIVGAGPGGLACAVKAQELGLSYVLLEKGKNVMQGKRKPERSRKMKTGKWAVGFLVSSLVLGGISLTIPENAVAQRVDKRIDSRQDRRGDRRENTAEGVQDREDHRQGRRDCTGDGPDCRSENRQDKRGDRQDRVGDHAQDRDDRLDERF